MRRNRPPHFFLNRVCWRHGAAFGQLVLHLATLDAGACVDICFRALAGLQNGLSLCVTALAMIRHGESLSMIHVAIVVFSSHVEETIVAQPVFGYCSALFHAIREGVGVSDAPSYANWQIAFFGVPG